MKFLQTTGLVLFVLALGIFTLMLGLDQYRLSTDTLAIDNDYHQEAFLEAARSREPWIKPTVAALPFPANSNLC
jgi:hypothetical protein